MKANDGFTLIEVLISLLLLAIILVGGMQLYINSNRIMTLATHKKIATELATAELEQAREDYALLVDGVVNTPQTFGSFKADVSRTVTSIDIPPADGIVDHKQVDVKIAWREAGKSNDTEVNLSTYLTSR